MGNVIEFGQKGIAETLRMEKEKVRRRCDELLEKFAGEGHDVVKMMMMPTGAGWGILYNVDVGGKGFIDFVGWTGETTRICDWEDRKESEWLFEGLMYQIERTWYDGADRALEEANELYGEGGMRSYDRVMGYSEGLKVCK